MVVWESVLYLFLIVKGLEIEHFISIFAFFYFIHQSKLVCE